MKSIYYYLLSFTFFSLLYSCNNEKTEVVKKTSKEVQSTDTVIAEITEEKPQTLEERISDIRKWFAEMQNLGEINCQNKSKTTYDSFGPDTEPMPFKQNARICNLTKEYQLIVGDFSGYEAGSTAWIYKKNGKIFFVFIEGGAEAWSYERRYYCDKDENVIRHLEREAEGGNEPNGPQTTMKLNSSAPKIRDYVSTEIAEIQRILKIKI